MREDQEGFPDREREERLLKRFERMRREGTFRYMDVSEFEEIIEAYLDKGQFDKAEQTVRLALRQHPSAFMLILKKAEIHLARAEYLLALEVLNPLTRLDPTNYEVFLFRGFALVHLERKDEALRDFERALELGSGMEGDIAFQAATELEMTGHYKEALRLMEQAYHHDPFDIQAMYELGFLYQQTGQHDRAIEIYRRYLREEPFDEGAWNNLGETLMERNDYQGALEAFEYQLAIHPASPDGLYNRGRVLMLMQRFGEAAEMFREYLQRTNDDTEAMLHLGKCYEMMGEYSRALSWYKVAAAENLDDPEPCFMAARLYRTLAQYDEAERCALKTLETDPEDPIYNFELFLVWEHTRPASERLGLIRNIVSRAPEEVNYWIELLSLLYHMRQMKEFRYSLADAYRHHPDHPLLLCLEGAVGLLEGRMDEGLDLIEEALQKDPEKYREMLKRFPQLDTIPEVKRLIQKYKP